MTINFDPSSIKTLKEGLNRDILITAENDANSKKSQTKLSRSEKGQLSIFLGMSLLVVTTFIAFVVNVGLFVKAKINLQNSVDAGAYAGAAVQARQLTNMAYLNWEMRNTFKEWLLKYYVFGNVGLEALNNIGGSEPSRSGGCPSGFPLNLGTGMNFRLRQFKGSNCQYYDSNVYDRYNVPSICVHFGSENNICEITTLPGLPRFESVGLPSISEQNTTFLNSIVRTKANDCSLRSDYNLGTALLWTYGTGSVDFLPNVPQIAADRIGAWVESLELALRMRNLEAIVNAPPQARPICRNPGIPDEDCIAIEDISSPTSSLPYNERSSKAFWSAFRNLSGGVFKNDNSQVDFAGAFTLREIPPTAFPATAQSLSGFLIPADSVGLTKYYLDLKAVPVNYSLFYTAFFSASADDAIKDATETVRAEATCGGTKAALPVPGYMLGFVKNPEVVTYYAVEGKSKFTGLFYPFTDGDGITLSAYAAAKPFGGRIGPALFNVGFDGGDDTVVTTRNASQKVVSSNYISILSTVGLGSFTTLQLLTGGFPIPTDTTFWADNSASSVVGGNPTINQATFGVPNLLYDYNSYNEIADLAFNANKPVNELTLALTDAVAYQAALPERFYGLYDKNQFTLFSGNRSGGAGAIFSSDEVAKSIHNVRRATRYEALNYMIPFLDIDGPNALGVDHNAYVQPVSQTAGGAAPGTLSYRLFAPLFGPDTLYTTTAAITATINDYITTNQSALDNYLESLKTIADGMREASDANPENKDAYLSAANTIYPFSGNLILTDDAGSDACNNISMAQKIQMFFSTTESGCGIVPLSENTTRYFNETAAGANTQKLGFNSYQYYYTSTWRTPTFGYSPQGMSGYKPGPRQGADPDGRIGSPFGVGTDLLAKRNFYSTKFIPVRLVTAGTDSYTNAGGSKFPIIMDPVGDDSNPQNSGLFIGGFPMRNTISADELQAYGSPPPF